MVSGAIDEALSSLKLQETEEMGTVEIVVEDMSERKEGSDGKREEARDGGNEKKEIEEGEEGIGSENEKRESDNDGEKKETEKREDGIDGGSDNIEIEEREDGSDINSEKKKSEEKEQGRNVESEEEIGDRRENKEFEEKEEVRDGDIEKKELSEKGEEKEEERDGKSYNKEGEKMLKERVKFSIPYPKRPFKQDCPSFLKTGYCSFGLDCWFNHPSRKSSTVCANRDCKEIERDGDGEKKEIGEKEGYRDGHSEKKEGEKMVKEPVKFPIRYPQRQFMQDCPSFLKSGYCSFGSVCCFNHPLKKSSKVCANGDYKEIEREGDGEKKEIGEKEGYRDGHSEAKGEERDGKSEKKEGEKMVKFPIPYPQRPFKQDSPSFLKTGYPPKKSSNKVCANGDCKERERGGDQEKKEWVEKGKVKHAQNYTRREGKEDCIFYLKTGWCSFGTNCCFNHPLGKDAQIYRQREGKGDCVFYLKSGRCSFGANCCFNHPPRNPDQFNSNLRSDSDDNNWEENLTSETIELNFLGLPIRPGKDDCPVYMKHGACVFSTDCQYNHPDPLPVTANEDTHKEFHKGDSLPFSEEASAQIYTPRIELMVVPTPKPSLARIKQMLLPPEKLEDYDDGKKESQDPVKPPVQSDGYNRDYSTKDTIYPERPGEPECMYYMNYGDCKFKSSCKFHHPKRLYKKVPVYSSFSQVSKEMSGNNFEEIEHPERLGRQECPFYMKYGNCKFKLECGYHHPRDRLLKDPAHSDYYNGNYNEKKGSQYGYTKLEPRSESHNPNRH